MAIKNSTLLNVPGKRVTKSIPKKSQPKEEKMTAPKKGFSDSKSEVKYRQLTSTVTEEHFDILTDVESDANKQLKSRKKVNRSALIRVAIERLQKDYEENPHEVLAEISEMIK